MHPPYKKNITIQAFEQKIPPWTEKIYLYTQLCVVYWRKAKGIRINILGLKLIEPHTIRGNVGRILSAKLHLFFPVLQEVIEAIAESAFKTSPYPVILSFENHVDS